MVRNVAYQTRYRGVGHIFQLGTRSTPEALKASVQGEDGRNQILTMNLTTVSARNDIVALRLSSRTLTKRRHCMALLPLRLSVAILPMNMLEILPCAGAGGKAGRSNCARRAMKC